MNEISLRHSAREKARALNLPWNEDSVIVRRPFLMRLFGNGEIESYVPADHATVTLRFREKTGEVWPHRVVYRPTPTGR